MATSSIRRLVTNTVSNKKYYIMDCSKESTTIIAALSTLPSSHLSHLIHTISSAHHRHLSRLVSVLSSPPLFSLSLRHLQSLSLHHKSLLIARHLLSNLSLLQPHFSASSLPRSASSSVKLRDLDSALLLLLLCEFHHRDRSFLDSPPSSWRPVLRDYVSGEILRLSRLGGGCSDVDVLVRFVESVRRCWNFVSAMGVGEGRKEGEVTAAAAAVVVALPSVVGGGGECAICKERMEGGRDVCELPCRHLFHWVCILRWLRKRDTCPCCRRRLPTDDVRREIERLLEDLGRIGGGGL